MFEQYKLNKYQEYIDSFAYEIYKKSDCYYNIQTYLILKKDKKIIFIKYKKYKNLLPNTTLENMVDMLEHNGYDCIESIIMNEKNNRNEKENTYKKSRFKVIK